MDGSSPRRRSAPQPGLRALEACGDGFWELDLESGAAWYSDWFYRKLKWSTETKHATLGHLESLFQPAAWAELMAGFRAHLEQGQPLELDVEITVPDGGPQRWRIRGSAQRNSAGQPVYLAGSMREVSAELRPGPELERLRSAVEALPVAAALLDARAVPLVVNRRWRECAPAATAQALARLRDASGRTALEFWLDRDDGLAAGRGRLRVRATAFQHAGARHLAVTLEERRSD